MEDIRMKTIQHEFQGRIYELRCNFNVLADIEAEAGSLGAFLRMGMMKAVLIALAAMLNDYAESVGWQERIRSKELGRMLSTEPAKVKAVSEMVMALVLDAIKAPASSEGAAEKN